MALRVQVQTNALMSVAEVAQGTRYTEALTTSWRPPRYYRDMTEDECDKLRAKWNILIDVSYLSPSPSPTAPPRPALQPPL